jgi:amino acid transporter
VAEAAVQPIENEEGFGTFAGVFTPTTLTILGAVLFLRTGWLVGNGGLLGALGIIALANAITIATGLSIASVATNIRVKAGGAFSIISQSLGLEVGGSVSVPFYIAQSVGVAFYVFAFAEGWNLIFPSHPVWLVIFVCFGVAFLIAFISASFASRTQIFILVLIGVSLFSVLLGSFTIPRTVLFEGTAFTLTFGSEGFTEALTATDEAPSAEEDTEEDLLESRLFNNYPDPDAGDFWGAFGIYFPAVTGILAGVNMSGDLRDPRKSIPVGTLAAQILSFAIYMIVAYWFWRVATLDELITNTLVMVDAAFFGPAILAGLLAATFSSALTSLVGAPRILQAISQYGVIPGGKPLAKLTKGGEPRNALYVTGGIAMAAILFGLANGGLGGGLNAIAPIMTMFFLITYAVLNGVVLLEKILGLVSFRPSFDVPLLVPLFGFVGTVFVMFQNNAAFSLIAVVAIILLYGYLTQRDLDAPFSDVRSGIFITLAEWASKQVGGTVSEGDERAWKPNLLVPVTSTEQFSGSYRFLRTLTYPRGSIRTLGIYGDGDRDLVAGVRDMTDGLGKDGVFARSSLLEVDHWPDGVSLSLDVLSTSLFRPNALFLTVTEDMEEITLNQIANRATRNQIGLVMYRQNPVTGLGREQTINVWIRERGPEWNIDMRLGNFHLALLMAYQIQSNWRGQINLITLVNDEAEKPQGERFLKQLIELGRMPNTQPIAEASDLRDYWKTMPRADLNIFGLHSEVNKAFIDLAVTETKSSCLFVRDSGLESALA